MVLFELVVGLLFLGALFSLWAERMNLPYPALLALVGAIVALIPGTPEVALDPELALALFVAPTLLDAAFDASPRDLRHDLGSVVSLAVVLVLLTVGAVAWAFRATVPGVGWAAAITLGAIVAPPDASAASAVLRKLQPPHRLLVILEGESLFNDATSLLIYRVAVGAAVTGAFSAWSVLPLLLLTCGGAVLLGWGFARLQIRLTLGLGNVPVNVVLQFIGTFGVWIVSERLGLSAIITVVAYAMTLARNISGRVDARRRIASYAVWEVAVMVLNVLAFVLIGLQLRGIVSRVHGHEWRTYALAATAVCVTVIGVRVAWITVYTAGARWRNQRVEGGAPPATSLATHGSALLASWCGMRGVVTLAAALALPDGGFPYRDLIVFCAFCVVLTTLVLQGLTLPPLMRRLRLRDDGIVEREVEVARTETARAALRALEEHGDDSASARLLRSEYEARLQIDRSRQSGDSGGDRDSLAALQRRAVAAQRRELTDLRARMVIGDDAFHVVEEEIDLLELTADVRVHPDSGAAPA